MVHMGENLHYTTSTALTKAYGQRLEGQDITQYLNSPERLANLVYAGRMGNGDLASGDGWSYRGRGLLQLTGRENYAKLSKDLSMDAVGDPELLNNPSMAVLSACWFWNWKSLNTFADSSRYEALTQQINPKRLHHEQRMSEMWHARECLHREVYGQEQ